MQGSSPIDQSSGLIPVPSHKVANETDDFYVWQDEEEWIASYPRRVQRGQAEKDTISSCIMASDWY
jgi:hypothetical protein